jgi:hypothetical protein
MPAVQRIIAAFGLLTLLGYIYALPVGPGSRGGSTLEHPEGSLAMDWDDWDEAWDATWNGHTPQRMQDSLDHQRHVSGEASVPQFQEEEEKESPDPDDLHALTWALGGYREQPIQDDVRYASQLHGQAQPQHASRAYETNSNLPNLRLSAYEHHLPGLEPIPSAVTVGGETDDEEDEVVQVRLGDDTRADPSPFANAAQTSPNAGSMVKSHPISWALSRQPSGHASPTSMAGTSVTSASTMMMWRGNTASGECPMGSSCPRSEGMGNSRDSGTQLTRAPTKNVRYFSWIPQLVELRTQLHRRSIISMATEPQLTGHQFYCTEMLPLRMKSEYQGHLQWHVVPSHSESAIPRVHAFLFTAPRNLRERAPDKVHHVSTVWTEPASSGSFRVAQVKTDFMVCFSRLLSDDGQTAGMDGVPAPFVPEMSIQVDFTSQFSAFEHASNKLRES